MSHSVLPTFRFPVGTCIAQAQPPSQGPVNLDSPALKVMTDLAEVRAATIHPDTPLLSAEHKMIHQGVRMLFVVTDMPCVDGVVTSGDLHGDKPMRMVNRRQVKYDDLCVADVMEPLSSLDVIDYSSLKRATVEHVVATLQQYGRPHLLVVEAASTAAPARIRGLISLNQVQRQLGSATPLHSTQIATTFAEIGEALS